ncbi:PucR family transcriptional regulator [Mycobacterium sp. THU-M104]|uniref:PucR family transcriptional regulator n=1 Tax=Mycobacterium sp. THU-M104 TaxID=3410515 RepID=UPI003B99C2BE
MTDNAGSPIRAVARYMGAQRERFIADLIDATTAQIRALDFDVRMVELLKASITENVVAAIHYLELDTPEIPLDAPPAAMGYARALAQRDVPLSALIRAYRFGHARFLDIGMQYALSLPPAERTVAIINLVNRSARWIDQICDQVGVAYEQEREHWVSRRSGLRQQWISQVLAGDTIDTHRAEEVLEYRFEGMHVAAVAWTDVAVPVSDVVTLFDQVRSLVAAELDAPGRTLLVPTDEREARLWFGVRSADGTDLSLVRTALEKAGHQVYLAFGNREVGLDGFRRSLKQAERAKAVIVTLARPATRVAFYADVAPVALMARDLDELRHFVGEVLGDLAIDDERTGWLRETLREFLSRNRSYVATANAMTLHRNTIQYRVGQALKLCGIGLENPDAVLRVQIALDACRWMASAVLRPAGPAATIRPG